MFSARVATIAGLCLVLIGYPLLAALAQDQNPSIAAGMLISRANDSVTVKTGEGEKTFRIDKQTDIWRGGTVDSAELKAGDDVSIRYHSDGSGNLTADSIEANVGHWEGVITKVVKDTVYIKFDRPVKGTGKVIFDSRTEFHYCAGDDLKRDCNRR
jgi:hypothetical protein